MSIPGLAGWLGSAQGRYVTDWERERIAAQVSDIFGFNALQIGLNEIDLLATNRMALRRRAGDFAITDVPCALTALPFATQSVDLVVLPHVLEFHADPHELLREIERILIPEGQLIITGFNPLSLWGLRRRFGSRDCFPWTGSYLTVLRLRDWLKLLGFEVDRGEFGCFVPPVSQANWLQRWHFLEPAGRRWWRFSGGVYLLRAVKRTPSLRLIKPKWNPATLRNKVLRPLAQKEHLQKETHGRH